MPRRTGIFYVYFWLREDGTPYYVGKGTNNRAYIDHSYVCRPKSDNFIILQNFSSEDEAFEAEKFFISYYGREDLEQGTLLNLKDGGEGAVHSDRILKQISNTHKRLGIRPPSRLGCKLSQEHKDKISEALKGHKPVVHSKEYIENLRQRMIGTSFHRGYKNTEETKQKMRISALKREPRMRTERGTYA